MPSASAGRPCRSPPWPPLKRHGDVGRGPSIRSPVGRLLEAARRQQHPRPLQVVVSRVPGHLISFGSAKRRLTPSAHGATAAVTAPVKREENAYATAVLANKHRPWPLRAVPVPGRERGSNGGLDIFGYSRRTRRKRAEPLQGKGGPGRRWSLNGATGPDGADRPHRPCCPGQP